MYYNDEIYRKVVVPGYESPTKEDPAIVVATRENNCFAVWYRDWEVNGLLGIFGSRDRAIEEAVEWGKGSYQSLRDSFITIKRT